MLKCFECGGTVAPGTLISEHAIAFEPRNAPATSFFTLKAMPTTVKVEALMCEVCGRIEMRSDTQNLQTIQKG